MSLFAKGFADLLSRMGITPDLLEAEMKKVVDGAIEEIRARFDAHDAALAAVATNVSSIQDHLAATSGYVAPTVAAAVVDADPAPVPFEGTVVEHSEGETADAADFVAPTVQEAAAAEIPAA